MKAAVIRSFGSSDCISIENVPMPSIGDGEVLVEVLAAGINPIDIKTRKGDGVSRLWKNYSFPIILGWDISGVVVESQSTTFSKGDEVFGMPNFPQIAGGYAQYCAAPSSQLTLKPKNISHFEAAATPLAALTAWQGLFEVAKLSYGQNILIHAGAGGVGHFSIQLAKWHGANVTTTTSNANIKFVRTLGADTVIDYKENKFWEQSSNNDVVFHMIDPRLRVKSYQTIKNNGFLISITGPIPSEEKTEYGVEGHFMSVRPNGEQISSIANLLGKKTIKVKIEKIYSFEEISKAHDHIETGHTKGKIIIDLKT